MIFLHNPRASRVLRIAVITLATLILFQVSLPHVGAHSPVSLANPDASSVSDFHLLSADEGWILVNQTSLYWTKDRGNSWTDITPIPPAHPSPALHQTQSGASVVRGVGGIRAAFFLDTHHGWVVSGASDSSNNYVLSRTVDTGAIWQTQIFQPDLKLDDGAPVAAMHMYWLNAQTGWLVLRRATGSSFDLGALFKTIDGGNSWTRLTIPIGDPVYFATADLGWTVGGAARNLLYTTRDGGRTWKPLALPIPPSPFSPPQGFGDLRPIGKGEQRGLGSLSPYLPRFTNTRDGVLPVIVTEGADTHLDLYRTHDAGETWVLGSRMPLGHTISRGTRSPIAITDTGEVTSPRMTEGIRELDMANSRVGWAKYAEGNCERGDALAPHASAGESRCTQTSRLLRTTDGGQTWETLPIPHPLLPSVELRGSSTYREGAQGLGPERLLGGIAATSSFTFTATVTGQGFDACGLPTTSEFQNWWANSPYRAYNLYIGGSALAACDALSASFIAGLASQGWKFFPTWVGPQASCYAPGYNVSRMSADTTTAYNQGVAEANSALDTAYNLGLTDSSKSGTVIYYDLEGYDTNNSSCRAAANSFMRGWSYQLKTRNNIAGAYGAACGSAVSDWANTDPDHIPNVLWLAWWQVPYQYRSNATVWGAPCLDDSLWVNHQRLRQYAGGHDETWGGVTLNIDSDVLDGVVASLSNVVKPLYKYYFPLMRR